MKVTFYAVYTYIRDLNREFHETPFDFVPVREDENIEDRVFKCVPATSFADSWRAVAMKTINVDG